MSECSFAKRDGKYRAFFAICDTKKNTTQKHRQNIESTGGSPSNSFKINRIPKQLEGIRMSLGIVLSAHDVKYFSYLKEHMTVNACTLKRIYFKIIFQFIFEKMTSHGIIYIYVKNLNISTTG